MIATLSGTIHMHIMMTPLNGIIFARYRAFVRGIHRSPVDSPHKGQWRGASMVSSAPEQTVE